MARARGRSPRPLLDHGDRVAQPPEGQAGKPEPKREWQRTSVTRPDFRQEARVRAQPLVIPDLGSNLSPGRKPNRDSLQATGKDAKPNPDPCRISTCGFLKAALYRYGSFTDVEPSNPGAEAGLRPSGQTP